MTIALVPIDRSLRRRRPVVAPQFSYNTCDKGVCADSFVPAPLYEDNWVTTQACELVRGVRARRGARVPYFLQVNRDGVSSH